MDLLGLILPVLLSLYLKMQFTHVDVPEFLRTGFHLKAHLARYLQLTSEEVDNRLPLGAIDLATFHPGSFDPENATGFYEDKVGTRHLFDLVASHSGSCD